ncbi:MAG TPA: hypothetical protein VI076_15545 [Actinopolymorphaceae bacterium]
MENLDSLYSVASLLTLQGAAAAALLVPNVLGLLIGETFDRYRKWTSFGVSLVLAFVAAGLADDTSWVTWIVAVFNGFLVFAAAMGVNQLPSHNRPAATDGPRFFRSWT